MKRKIFLVLIFFSYITFSQEQLMENEVNRDELFLLTPYVSYREVIAKFGEPDDVVGSGFVIIQYVLLDGRKAELNFGRGDKLYALVEIPIMGERRIIFNTFLSETSTN